MPWAVLLGEGIDDPAKFLEALLDRGICRVVEGGYIVELDDDDDNDPRRRSNRARQARYRARRRNARNAETGDARNARNALEGEEFDELGGGNYPSPPLPGGDGWVTAETVTRVTRNASNAEGVTREALRVGDDDRAAWDMGPPLTEAERLAAQARIREIGDALRARRTDERPSS